MSDQASEYVRRCPSCRIDNAPQVMRCACGALLAGVDLSLKNIEVAPSAAVPAVANTTASAPTVLCPHADCGQSNPADSLNCVYCNRPMSSSTPATSLLRLPTALATRFRIERALPTAGAEAELLLVRDTDGTQPIRVVKLYRHGIHPRAEVQQRLERVNPRHRIQMFEAGVSEGHAYELMEYCEFGSLRGWLSTARTSDELRVMVRELAQALADVHGVGLLHRDLKPENVLLRSLQPLDLVLTDFSTSSVIDATQRFTGMARTLPYAAPESLSGVIDAKSDYWALGVMVLEALLQAHPYAGLSEAVILHHLTTRAMDLSGVRDTSFRKLLRGLLLRDPQQRWGANELVRWLADDMSLTEPSAAEELAPFHAPYHLGDEVCHTPAQLAVALARDWTTGVRDIRNGLLQAWFNEVQKDQNTLRLLLEMRFERKTPPDQQLLQLILHLAPGIPPVWRGESIELRAILSRVERALRGDAASEQWLEEIHEQRVLEAYAVAGNAELACIVTRWDDAATHAHAAWKALQDQLQNIVPALHGGPGTSFDDVAYGSAPTAPRFPMPSHAQLLTLTYDPRWVEQQRAGLLMQWLNLVAQCPELGRWGDPQAMGVVELLVWRELMPVAREHVERHIQAQARARDQDLQDAQRFKQELGLCIAEIKTLCRRRLRNPEVCAQARSALERYFDLLAQIKASGRVDEEWRSLQRTAGRPQRAARQILELIDRLSHRRMQNTGWLGHHSRYFVGILVLLATFFLNGAAHYLLVAVGLGVVTWRVLPNYILVTSIRRLAASM